jgi:tripartite-type tricarboxylate transporter receptor subunit TctC
MAPVRRTVFAAFLSLLAAAPAAAQDAYPSKPIRLVLGFAPGGISDVLGRALAVRLSQTIGQQIIVENRPGAGGSLAAGFVAKSAPDGYTIWLQDMTSHAINQSLYSNLPYHPINDFAPITLVAYSPLMLAVHPSQPTHTVKELVEYLQTNKERRTYASAGNGTPNHLAAELLRKIAGISDLVHVPYKGSAPSVVALLGNEIAFSFLSMPPAVANVRNGKLRGLAVTSANRVSAVPNLPTMVESGYPDFELVVYTGVLAPAGTPAPIIARLNAELAKTVASDDVKNVYATIGAEGITDSPAEFRAMMEKDIAKYAPLVKASGARVD